MALATTPNRNYPIVDDAPTSYLDTVIIPGLASLANMVDADIASILTSVAGKVNTSAIDTDGTLAANSDAKIATQKATKTYVGAYAQPLDARLSAIVATGITAAMFATNVVDTDATLAANSASRIPAQSAVKSYVDNAITGVFWKPAVDVATTANITLSGEQTIDGVLTSASRVLVKNQTTASQNGLYLSGSGAWTRVSDADTGFELWGATVAVRLGTTQKNTQWTNSNTSQPTLGSTNITFAQISGAGTYSATGGVILTGNQFSVDTGTSGHKIPWLDGANTWGSAQVIAAGTGVTLSNSGQMNFTTAAASSYINFNTGGSAGTVTFRNGSGFAQVAQWDASGNLTNTGSVTATSFLVGSDPVMTRGSAEAITGVKQFGSQAAQSNTLLSNRARVNAFEWGHANTGGYGSTLGMENGSGLPNLVFSGEGGTNNSTYRTRGLLASILRGDAAGGFVWGTVGSTNADNQSLVQTMALSSAGLLSVTGNAVIGNSNTGAVGRYVEIAGADNKASAIRFTEGGGARWILGRNVLESAADNNFYLRNAGLGSYAITVALSNNTLRFHAYGAGTLVTDSSGNVTVSSDERLKVMGRVFTRGIEDMLRMDSPRFYRWRKKTGMDQSEYVGFGAQGVRKGIREAVGKDPRGNLTLQDRPLIATHHNAIIALHKRIAKLERRLAA